VRHPPKAFDRDLARNCLLTNLLALPGLGSFIAGRRVTGFFQAALALTGFGLTGFWFFSFIALWFRTGEFPMDGGPQFPAGLAGVGLFAGAWCWALVTGLAILRKAHAGKDDNNSPTQSTS
jgi:hypothetical protein